ncbi:hypothetical protein EI555_008206 [Monodon monoceros]|uniref:Dihydrolipoyllysine-residue succinyltransferase component of 2-oxoglutarate dehydrogenase complex, mitochondrial n=1 Tax=Monodon monoceros TaxID=40151 RepID=A0A4U1F8E0_MONMO|nr:hypothetical protein EI555_008206 [Monodon monoceros]
MLSRSRFLSRAFSRSVSAFQKGSPYVRDQVTLTAGRLSLTAVVSSLFAFSELQLCAVKDDVITVKTPAFAESVTEGDVRWEKAVGDTVAEDEVVCEIETDKLFLLRPGQPKLLLPQPQKQNLQHRQFLLPLQHLYPLRCHQCPRPHNLSLANQCTLSSFSVSAVKPTAAPPVAEPGAGTGLRSEHREKMNRMRQRIAQRLKEAQNTCAMLTTFNEIDMSNIQEMRSRHKDAFLKKHNLKLGFMSAFVKASAFALQEQPVVNAVIDDTTKEVVYRDYIDISVAVATPRGLVVPVIRNVETMNYGDIERTISELGEKARKNELAIEDMDGGTFTISNGGVFGSLFGTPIINPPQSAILGMHAIFDRPVVVGGKVEVRPMMYVALTYDHRLIDGREAVTFLRKIKAAVEDPRVLLLDL